MDLRQLEYFVAIAEERSVTHAAARLGVAQSAASTALRRLERALGAELVVRGPGGLQLTDAGAALLPEARGTLAAAGRARAAVDAVAGGLRGTVRMGTVEATNGLDVTAVLGAFRARNPGVRIELTHVGDGPRQLVFDVLEGRLDFALAGTVGPGPAGVELTTFWEAPMQLVVPEGHALASRSELSPAELPREPFIRYHAGGPAPNPLNAALAACGADVEVGYVVRWMPTSLDMVREGLGPSLAPASAIPWYGEGAGLRGVPLVARLPPIRFVLARPTNRRLSVAAEELADALLAAYDPSTPLAWAGRR